MLNTVRRIQASDIAMTLAVAGLIMVGLVTLAGISEPASAGFESQIVRQAIFVVIGIALYVIVAAIDYRLLSIFAWAGYFFAVLALVLVLLLGVERFGESGTIRDLYSVMRIDAEAIASASIGLLSRVHEVRN